MAKYGAKASEKVERAIDKMKQGTLKSGQSGKPVKSRAQAIAIGLSEARQEGGKVPRKSDTKTTSKKVASKKSAARKAPAKKAAAKKAPARHKAKPKG